MRKRYLRKEAPHEAPYATRRIIHFSGHDEMRNPASTVYFYLYAIDPKTYLLDTNPGPRAFIFWHFLTIHSYFSGWPSKLLVSPLSC